MTTHNKLERYKDLLIQRQELQVQINAEMQAFKPCRNAINCLHGFSKCNTCKKRDAIRDAGYKAVQELRAQMKQVRFTLNKPSLKRAGYTNRISKLRTASISDIKARYNDI
mgnify:CR=1 FL=1